MSAIEPFTPEGVDPNNSYVLTCIDRVNTNYKAAIAGITGVIDPTQLATLVNDVATLKTKQITINVKDYGAVGDDVANDTVAIQNAVNALPTNNGILYFPKGTYRLNNLINITSKHNLLIISDSANIRHTAGTTIFFFTTCFYTRISGLLRLFTETTGQVVQAICIDRCILSQFNNIVIYGDFLYGIHVYNQSFPGCSITATIYGCRYGIFYSNAGEYTLIINCIISNCSNAGIYCTGANINITGCQIVANLIGIIIEGVDTGLVNTDHSGIESCTINHNTACGIFVKNIYLSLNISTNNIWATNQAACTIPLKTEARSYSYAIYIENSPNVNITGNIIAYSTILIGCDGYNNCIISNNHLMSASSVTQAFIYEFGNTNSRVSNTNFNNIITNNIFSGQLLVARKRILLHDNTNSYGYVMKNNRGTTNSYLYNNLIINIVGTYDIGQEENISIDASVVGLASMPSNDAAGVALQATNIIILPHLRGEKIELQFYNTNQTKYWVWIKFKTDDTTTQILTVGNGIMQHMPANKAICINTRICNRVNLTPYGTGSNQWICSGVGAA